jgi:hypothetical protein
MPNKVGINEIELCSTCDDTLPMSILIDMDIISKSELLIKLVTTKWYIALKCL